MGERTCSVEGCGKAVQARGWCNTHYSRWRVQGDPGPAEPLLFRNTEPVCTAEGCERKSERQNMCMAHLWRLRRHGDPHGGGLRQDHRPLAERYVDRCERQPNGCLRWMGAVSGSGYPHVGADNQDIALHQWVYAVHVGEMPSGWTVDHLCHNRDPACPGGVTCGHRRCVEPSHLEAVPHGLNTLRGRIRQNLPIGGS